MQHAYFSSLDQSNPKFVTLSLLFPSSMLKLPNDNEFPAGVTVVRTFALRESKKHLFLTSLTVVKRPLRDPSIF